MAVGRQHRARRWRGDRPCRGRLPGRLHLTRPALTTAVLLVASFRCDPALAHSDIKMFGSFYTGLLHPFLVPAHVLAIAGTGLLIGQLPRGVAAIPFLVFVAAYWASLILTLFGANWLPAMQGVVATTAFTGLFVAIGLGTMLRLVIAAAALSGLMLGLDSGAEGNTFVSRLLLTAGTFVGGATAVMAVCALTLELPQHWQRIAVRIVGSWTAATAVMILALTLARLRN